MAYNIVIPHKNGHRELAHTCQPAYDNAKRSIKEKWADSWSIATNCPAEMYEPKKWKILKIDDELWIARFLLKFN